MKRFMVIVTASLAAVGCGKKADDVQNAANAIAAAATAAPRIEAGMKEAEQFQKERVAKGDTLAMAYGALQKFLPASVDGYAAKEAPGGSQQAMGAFSMSEAEQTWVKPAGAGGNTPEIKVSITDFGGTQQGYTMLAAPMLMGFSQEDAHRRVGSIKVDVPHAGAWEEFDKDNKSAKITAVARYRYLIAVESRNSGEDQSAAVKRLAEEIARKFDGK